MKSVYLINPFHVIIKDILYPIRKEEEAFIKVKAVGICGSDISAYKGTIPTVIYPRIIGHEIAGQIIEAPKNNTKLKAGDRVVVEPYFYCGNCYPCSLGRTNNCEKSKVLGVQIDGGMAEQISIPSELIYKIPNNMLWEHAAMVEPLSIALHAVHRAGLKKGEHVVITGSGTIGLLVAQVAMNIGAIPIVIDLITKRLKIANDLGIAYVLNPNNESIVNKIKEITHGRMAEVFIEASGADMAIKSFVDCISFSGRISLVGWPKSEVLLPEALFIRKEIDIRGSRNSACEFPESIDLIANEKVNVKAIISDIVSLNNTPEFLEKMTNCPDKYLKVITRIE